MEVDADVVNINVPKQIVSRLSGRLALVGLCLQEALRSDHGKGHAQ